MITTYCPQCGGVVSGIGDFTSLCTCQRFTGVPARYEPAVIDEKQHGWVCPVCGTGIAPWVPTCPCKHPKQTTRGDL